MAASLVSERGRVTRRVRSRLAAPASKTLVKMAPRVPDGRNARGDPYGRVPGLGGGAGDPTREEQASRPGEQDARQDGPEDTVAEIRERLLQLVPGDVVDQDAFDGP